MRKKTLESESGFTLIEALVAMVVLTIGILSLFTMQINSIKGNARADRLTTASTWNADQVEKMIGMQYSDATLEDSNSNGEGGLDDITSTTADNSFFTDDGRYTFYLNVAADVPMENVKTIRVHVQDNRQVLSRPVAFTYIKNGTI